MSPDCTFQQGGSLHAAASIKGRRGPDALKAINDEPAMPHSLQLSCKQGGLIVSSPS
jgi:hypothetical protein